jgi:CHAD domain-containing protein
MTPNSIAIEPLNSSERPSTVGAFAQKIFEKQFSKFVKWEPEVLADTDPEPLHQMRVASRKLRTVLQLFKPSITIQPSLYRDITQVAKCLGEVRDLDVLLSRVRQHQTQPQASLEEQAQLCLVMHQIDRRRQKRFKSLTKTLMGSTYSRLIRRCQEWFDTPKFPLEAQWQTSLALPGVLMPLVHAWLNHPAWLIETARDRASTNGVVQNLDDKEDIQQAFHDLRKLTKHVRYQTEFCKDFYGSELSNFISELKEIQELLGKQQDNVIFAAFLEKILGNHWPAKVPFVAQTLQQAQASFDAQWQPFRDIYLNPKVRGDRQAVLLNPSSLSPS